MKEQIVAEIANFFYPVLLGMVAFFLIQFYQLVKKMNDKLETALIDGATTRTKVEAHETSLGKIDEKLTDHEKRIYILESPAVNKLKTC